MKTAILFLSAVLLSHTGTTPARQHTENLSMHAEGTFDVKVTPQAADNPEAEASGVARLSLSKQFHGELEATGVGEMLASGDGSQSGAYVAIEKVSGSLQGLRGTFVLVHRALMVGGTPQEWSVAVVPDSGSGQLQGLAGSMRITIAEGRHFYDFTYTLPKS